MAITFDQDIDALIALLATGGYALRSVRSIPGSCGRNADLYLVNGVVICWDVMTRKIWIDRVSRRGRHVENFLERMCEGPRVFRVFAICHARLHAHTQVLHQAAAFWLLRSESFIARNLRQQISRP
jgi:hypothetical protein